MKRKKKNVRPADIHKLNRDIADLKDRMTDRFLTEDQRKVAGALSVPLFEALSAKLGIRDGEASAEDLLNVLTARTRAV